MKNSEEAIDRVLEGLRETEVPAGMERRILRALEEGATGTLRSRWWRVDLMARSPAWGFALAGLLAVAVAIPAIRRLGHSTANEPLSAAPMKPLEVSAHDVVAKRAESVPSKADVRPVRKIDAQAKAERARVGADGDAVALNERDEASFPAPPMPLTDQERLLLRIAHRRDPVEVAELDPVMRAVREAEDKAEVKKFFEPTTTKGNE
jgi:hypothetical protein